MSHHDVSNETRRSLNLQVLCCRVERVDLIHPRPRIPLQTIMYSADFNYSLYTIPVAWFLA
jgi:hypothetical protein